MSKINKKTVKKKAVKKKKPDFESYVMENLNAEGDGVFGLVDKGMNQGDLEQVKRTAEMLKVEHAKFVGLSQFLANRLGYEIEVKTFFRFRKK